MRTLSVETVRTVAFESFREMFELATRGGVRIRNLNGDFLTYLFKTDGTYDFYIYNPGETESTGCITIAESISRDFSNVDEDALAHHWNLGVFTGETHEETGRF